MTAAEYQCTCFFNMVLAAYLSNKPDQQVKQMAKKYAKGTGNKTVKSTMKRIANSASPATTVKLAYDNLSS